MLNYIWTGLIALSLVFALWTDFSDLSHDRYRNGGALPVTIRQATAPGGATVGRAVDVVIDPAVYHAFYHVVATPAAKYAGVLVEADGKSQVRFAKDVTLPAPLKTIRDMGGGEGELLADVATIDWNRGDGSAAPATLRFKPVRFVRLQAIGQSATDFAKKAIEVALSLVGVLALWLGLMRIAEKSGLIDLVVKVIQPVLRPLFPEIPPGHPALGMIALNLTAGMLGLGNAATPFGLKAMEELQKLNKTTDTATNPMIMLLAANTALIQLVPSASLVAILGLSVSRIYFPIIATTGCAMIIAILATKVLSRVPAFAKTNPDLLPTPAPADVPPSA